MPDILAEVSGSWLKGKQTAFLEAVHQAVVHALETPEDEPLARLIEHSAGSFVRPRSAGERFTRIEIVLFEGRSLEAKRELYRTLVQNLHRFDIPPEDVKVVLLETTPENVGFRGGQAACDVELGYSIGTAVSKSTAGPRHERHDKSPKTSPTSRIAAIFGKASAALLAKALQMACAAAASRTRPSRNFPGMLSRD
jgi:hypothetical protein